MAELFGITAVQRNKVTTAVKAYTALGVPVEAGVQAKMVQTTTVKMAVLAVTVLHILSLDHL
jgi:hypothetical protein